MPDGLKGYPGLARPGRGTHQDVTGLDLIQGIKLKGIRFERCGFWNAYFTENRS